MMIIDDLLIFVQSYAFFSNHHHLNTLSFNIRTYNCEKKLMQKLDESMSP